MIINIVLKELKNNLTSLRFLLTMALTLILMISSTVLFSGIYKNRVSEFREVLNRNNERLNTHSSNLSSVAFERQEIRMPPTPMELIAEGSMKDIPNTFQITAFEIDEPEGDSAENKFMRKFTNVDWTFIISFILSFFAVLLTYDSISGEKTDGTLRMTLSHSISRNALIFGKYISALITITIPLIVGIILSLLISIGYGQITFSMIQIGKVIIYVVASLFFLSIFILVGLLVTSLTKSSITSIIALLFIWVLFVVLIPSSGGKISTKFFSIETREEIDRLIEDRRQEIQEVHLSRNPRALSWTGDPWYEHVPARAACVNEMADARNSISNEYMFKRINQIRKAKSILLISPSAVFNSLSEHICTTGLNAFEEFYSQIYNFRNLFHRFIVDKDKLDPDSPHLVYEWERTPMSQKAVDSSFIPRFQLRKLSMSETIQKALYDFIILIFFNIVLFVFVYVAIQRYDVR